MPDSISKRLKINVISFLAVKVMCQFTKIILATIFTVHVNNMGTIIECLPCFSNSLVYMIYRPIGLKLIMLANEDNISISDGFELLFFL